MADHEHSDDCVPETCFRAKMRFIRASGGLALATPKMAPGVSFYDTTIKTEADRMKAEARAGGFETRLKNPRYDK